MPGRYGPLKGKQIIIVKDGNQGSKKQVTSELTTYFHNEIGVYNPAGSSKGRGRNMKTMPTTAK